MTRLYCACCGRPFERKTRRGPAPLYCSDDCRRQIAVRRRMWSRAWGRVEGGRPERPGNGDQRGDRPDLAA
ncbi:hypothetical protein [Azospirillum sp.]|uniref:hypothetical protein n=1 Tax=Azospirillum sp. TaxID=34012 RepID=UPI002D6A2A59|nr:hypothetical protein [Azospirillum sp.]HYD70702.1 hypothetical protein [Azospirillum sp.]